MARLESPKCAPRGGCHIYLLICQHVCCLDFIEIARVRLHGHGAAVQGGGLVDLAQRGGGHGLRGDGGEERGVVGVPSHGAPNHQRPRVVQILQDDGEGQVRGERLVLLKTSKHISRLDAASEADPVLLKQLQLICCFIT